MVACDSPAATAVVEVPPLYGTCSTSMPAMCVNSTPARWLWKPDPAFAMLILPGFAFAYAINSLTFLYGIFGFTARTFCVLPINVIIAKSFVGW